MVIFVVKFLIMLALLREIFVKISGIRGLLRFKTRKFA